MNRFIELTYFNGRRLILDVSRIRTVREDANGCVSVFSDVGAGMDIFTVKDSYEEVKIKLCAI